MSESRSSLFRVVRELVARHATGVLAVDTTHAAGEVRLRVGVIEDVVYGRSDGPKALVRMLATSDLRFAFREGAGNWLRRIELETPQLLEEAAAASEPLREAIERFFDRRASYAIAVDLPTSGVSLSPEARALWTKLRVPVAFADLLDLADDDRAALAALSQLEAATAIRWLEFESERQPLGAPHWDVERVRERFGDHVRLAVAGTSHRVAVFTHALLHVDDVVRPAVEEPLVPMPHVVATLSQGGLTLDVVGCPLVPAYAPLWSLVLAGSALVVRLDEAALGVLEAAASLANVRVASAEALVGPLDEARVGAVAALVRAALDEAVNPVSSASLPALK